MSFEASDLTSLSWLHNLNIMDNLSSVGGTAPPTPPASPQPDHPSRLSGLTGVHRKRPSSSTSSSSNSSGSSSASSSSSLAVKEEEKEIDYKTVGDVKPPYSYASLICMAMKTNKHKMTLSSIYKWIKENFLYYRNADPSWQVSHFSIARKSDSKQIIDGQSASVQRRPRPATDLQSLFSKRTKKKRKRWALVLIDRVLASIFDWGRHTADQLRSFMEWPHSHL